MYNHNSFNHSNTVDFNIKLIEGKLLVLEIHGVYTPGFSVEPMDQFIREIENNNVKGCIIDYRDGSRSLSELESSYRTQLAYTLNLPKDCKYAVVAKKDDEEYQKAIATFLERGWIFKYFNDFDEAIAWLQM